MTRRLATLWTVSSTLVLAVVFSCASDARAAEARTTVAQLPTGTSALDARAAWRDAESRTYRLAADGVRSLTCRVGGQWLDAAAAAVGESLPPDFEVRFEWREGAASAHVSDDAALSAMLAGHIEGTAAGLAEILVPGAAATLASGWRCHFLAVRDPWLLPGETGIEARPAKDSKQRAVIAIGANGLIARERIESADGISEIAHRHEAAWGKQVRTLSTGTYRGEPVRIAIAWGTLSAGRPVPTRVTVTHGELPPMTFDIDDHRINQGTSGGTLVPGEARGLSKP